MMKSLTILGGLALSFNTVNAWAETFEVDIYGKVHMSIDHSDIDGEGTDTDLVSNASRLGFKGGADLDYGLKAIFQYEVGLDLDGNTGDKDFWSQRNQFGGVEGGFGRVIAGIHDTPVKQLEGKIDQFNDTYADFGGVIVADAVSAQEREREFLGYYSPTFNNFRFQLATMPGADSKNDFGDAFSASVIYGDPGLKQSNYYFGVGYDHAVDGDDTSVVRLVGSAKYDNLSIGAIIENADNDEDDQNRYLLSSAYNIGRGAMKFQYAYAEEFGEIGEVEQFSVGWEQKLGKAASTYILASTKDYDEGGDADYASVGFIYNF